MSLHLMFPQNPSFDWFDFLYWTAFPFLIILCSALLHEIGHYYGAKTVKSKKVSIGWFRTTYETKGLNSHKEHMILLSGVLLGFIPILILSMFYFDTQLLVILIAIYIYGCWNDIKEIFSDIDELKRNIQYD